MSTTYSEDHPDRKAPATVAATPVEGDSEAAVVEAKVVTAAKPAKKSSAKPTTKAKG